MVIFLCIVIAHTAGIAKGFGWENDLSPPPRYRCCQSSRKQLWRMILWWTLLWCLILLSVMDRRWIVMITRTRGSGVSIKKIDGVITAPPRILFLVRFLLKGLLQLPTHREYQPLQKKRDWNKKNIFSLVTPGTTYIFQGCESSFLKKFFKKKNRILTTDCFSCPNCLCKSTGGGSNF